MPRATCWPDHPPPWGRSRQGRMQGRQPGWRRLSIMPTTACTASCMHTTLPPTDLASLGPAHLFVCVANARLRVSMGTYTWRLACLGGSLSVSLLAFATWWVAPQSPASTGILRD
eukprot:159765-Chlamydomonas_euryale.AAC.1